MNRKRRSRFLGYYFDLEEDVFKFDAMNQYHLYKAAQDYEILKSGLGEYVKKVEQQRSNLDPALVPKLASNKV